MATAGNRLGFLSPEDSRLKREGFSILSYVDGRAPRDFVQMLADVSSQCLKFLVPRMSLGGLFTLKEKTSGEKIVKILLSASPDRLLSFTPAERLVKNQIAQAQIAKSLVSWVKQSAIEVRRLTSESTVSGMMIFSGESTNEQDFVTIGNPELTRECFAVTQMNEAALVTCESDAANALTHVYDRWWSQGVDVKNELLAELSLFYTENSPQFVYFLSLWNLFKDEIEHYRAALKDDRKLEETPIWKQLFAFQRHGAMAALRKLKADGGCILADSVGLGKTFTALAIAKAYERMGERVLVICPKKLRSNWERFLSLSSPFKNECGDPDFRYYVLSHTDMREGAKVNPARPGGKIKVDDFLSHGFGLIIIDESHNFKNHTGQRYKFLLKHLLAFPQTKLLLLSATPVNNRLAELTHQLALIHRVQLTKNTADGEFRRNVESILRQSQKVVNAWNHAHADDPGSLNAASLLAELPSSYFNLLQRYTIARNRHSITRFYANAAQEIGTFPERTIRSHYPKIDTEGKAKDIAELADLLEEMTLAAYNPLSHLKQNEVLADDSNLSDRSRQRALVALMRMNALKRLESSVSSFARTIESTFKERIEQQIDALANGKLIVPQVTLDALGEEDAEEIEGDKKHSIISAERFNIDALLEDIVHDSKIVDEILLKAKEITDARDAKIKYLNALLNDKASSPFNPGNKKALIFTAFADTAEYLAGALAADNPSGYIAFLTGSRGIVFHGGEKSSLPMDQILSRFAPLAQNAAPEDAAPQIDWLVATDCLSEGQNLQDCDMLVNYDIHWNPLRLNQRAGRIDRIGSKNSKIEIHNFWPMETLDDYIGLERRIRMKDALASLAGSGVNNLDDMKIDLKYREQQLREMMNGRLESDLISAASVREDFTEYYAELDAWLLADEKNESRCLKSPLAMSAATPAEVTSAFAPFPFEVPTKGIIFLFRRDDLSEREREENVFHEYFLVCVTDKGERVMKTDAQNQVVPVSQVDALMLFRALARDRRSRDVSSVLKEKTFARAYKGALHALEIETSTNKAQLLLGDVPFDYHTGATESEEALTLVASLVVGEVL